MKIASHLYDTVHGPVHIVVMVYSMDATEAIDVYQQNKLFESGGFRIEGICNGIPSGTHFYPRGYLGTAYDGSDDTNDAARQFLIDFHESRGSPQTLVKPPVDQVDLTISVVNETLKSIGAKERLKHDQGHFAFHGGNTSKWSNNQIELSNVSDQSLFDWIQEWHTRFASNLGHVESNITHPDRDTYEEVRGDYTLNIEANPDRYSEGMFDVSISRLNDGVSEEIYSDSEFSYTAALQNGLTELERYMPTASLRDAPELGRQTASAMKCEGPSP